MLKVNFYTDIDDDLLKYAVIVSKSQKKWVLCKHRERNNQVETFGMLYYADISRFEVLPNFEIEKIELFDELPDNWTYPEIQPILLEKVNNVIRA